MSVAVIGVAISLAGLPVTQEVTDAASRIRVAKEIVEAIRSEKALPDSLEVRQMTGDQAVIPVVEVKKRLDQCVLHEATDNLFAGDGAVFGVKLDFKCEASKWSTLIVKFVAGKLSEVQFHNQGVVFVPSPPPLPRPKQS